MSALDKNASTQNFLSPINFTVHVKRAKNANYFCQKANIPAISLPDVGQANPFVDIPQAGDHLIFETFDMEFAVDEDFSNYLEIWCWKMSLGFPERTEQYGELLRNPEWTSLGTKSEIILTVLNNSKNPNLNVTYHGCVPVGLSGLQFDTGVEGKVPVVTCSASFRYDTVSIERLINGVPVAPAGPSAFETELPLY